MDQIAKSGALKETLLYVLAIGNFINHGLKVGEEGVQGFKIDSLVQPAEDDKVAFAVQRMILVLALQPFDCTL